MLQTESIIFVKHSVYFNSNGRVTADNTVPSAKICDAYTEFLPYFKHINVHMAAGGAADAISTVCVTGVHIPVTISSKDITAGIITSFIDTI